MKRFVSIMVIITLLLSGCSQKKEVEMKEESYTTDGGEQGWMYLPDAAIDNPEEKRPLVLVTCAFRSHPEEKLQQSCFFWFQSIKLRKATARQNV